MLTDCGFSIGQTVIHVISVLNCRCPVVKRSSYFKHHIFDVDCTCSTLKLFNTNIERRNGAWPQRTHINVPNPHSRPVRIGILEIRVARSQINRINSIRPHIVLIIVIVPDAKSKVASFRVCRCDTSTFDIKAQPEILASV